MPFHYNRTENYLDIVGQGSWEVPQGNCIALTKYNSRSINYWGAAFIRGKGGQVPGQKACLPIYCRSGFLLAKIIGKSPELNSRGDWNDIPSPGMYKMKAKTHSDADMLVPV